MIRRAALVAVVALAAVALVRVAWRRATLPPVVTVEDVVATLSAPAAGGRLQPGDPLRGDGPRQSVLAPPPSRLAFRVDVPTDASLRFSVGVEGPGRRERGRSGVRFAVAVDGREAWARVVNPAASRHDRRWFDERIDLAAFAGRSVEIALATAAERDDAPLAGTPGWTHVRVVRETRVARQRAAADRPNILVVLVDTLRADRLGCYGASPSPTPALDALAARGLLFEEMVAQSSWTMPSVATIFTGLHPRSHGALGDVGRARRDRGGNDDVPAAEFLPDGVVTWAEAAARAGITTVGVSANPLVSRATNLAQGFETFVDLPWDPEGRNWTPAGEVDRTFLDWLAANRGWRFLAYLQYMEPHDPYVPPPSLRPEAPPGIAPAIAAGWVRDLANAVNWGGAAAPRPDELAHLRDLYTAEVRGWDEAFASLLRGLDRLGVLDSTVIVVTADHGEEFHEHGHLTHGAHLYDESVRVPLVVAGPGIPAARRRGVAQGIDVFPTVAALLGVAPPPGLPGRDVVAAIASDEDRPVVSETGRGIAPDGRPVRVVSVRSRGWKLIHTPALGRFELYDLAHDVGERDDRYGAAPEGARLAGLLQRWEAAAAAPPVSDGGDPALDAKLRALGYVE